MAGLSLDNVRAVLRLLGDPQEDVPAVHITGTNGKGSTAHLTARILEAHGLRTGNYASPHVERINERIQVGTEPISDERLAEALTSIRLIEDAAELTPSWFEIMTAAAFRIFSDEAVDASVIEVGMLGRYDATNVANTRLAVITNIARDHTDGGPGWREAITAEKVGIVKPGVALILGEIDDDLLPIVEAEQPERLLRLDHDFWLLNNELAYGGRSISVRTPRGQYEDVFIGLHGAHQGTNALLAIVAAEEFLDSTLEDELLTAAMAEPVMPARFEVVGHEPLIILDAGHNPAGAAAAAETLRRDFAVVGQRYLLVGWMAGRDPVAMLEALDAAAAELVVITEPRWPRATPAAEIAAAARALDVPHEIISSPLDGLDRLRTLAADNDVILVAGSFYLAGPIRTALRDSDRDDPEEAESDEADLSRAEDEDRDDTE